MGNCLKTQLKEEVTNDNLSKLGILQFKGKQTTAWGSTIYPRIIITPGIGSNFTLKDVTSDTSETINSSVSKVLSDQHSYEFSPKYSAIASLEFQAIESTFEEFDYMDINTLVLKYSVITGYMGNLPSSLVSLTVNSTKIGFESKLIDLSHMTNLKTLYFESAPPIIVNSLKNLPLEELTIISTIPSLNGNVSDLPIALKSINVNWSSTFIGDVVDLARLINCTSFKIKNCPITGTLESLVTALTGHVSGNIVFNFYGTSVTYQGNAWSSDTDVTINFD